jgi:hypothetical protein
MRHPYGYWWSRCGELLKVEAPDELGDLKELFAGPSVATVPVQFLWVVDQYQELGYIEVLLLLVTCC